MEPMAILDCWGILAQTPRTNVRHQESDQEQLISLSEALSLSSLKKFSPKYTLLKTLSVGMFKLTVNLTMAENIYF